ncbi:MAG TPA: GNAT family N-acetyltransferase [Solirubrobacteraceae bacterium]|nr:GNAT family N-acetyltransferase [Solirubrobacteraceae bacterium]
MRPARPDDVPAVLSLWATSRSAAATTPDTPCAVRRLVAADPGALLLAEMDGRIVGALIAASDGWRGSMYRLAVDPQHRRRGIARRLIAFGEARLRERGVPRVTALVNADDDVATTAWEALGYGRDAGISRFVKSL